MNKTVGAHCAGGLGAISYMRMSRSGAGASLQEIKEKRRNNSVVNTVADISISRIDSRAAAAAAAPPAPAGLLRQLHCKFQHTGKLDECSLNIISTLSLLIFFALSVRNSFVAEFSLAFY